MTQIVKCSLLSDLCVCVCVFINELGDGGYVVCYEMTDIERKLGFGRDSLVNYLLTFQCTYHNVHFFIFYFLFF